MKDINRLINLTKYTCTSNFLIGELQFTNNLLPTILLCYDIQWWKSRLKMWIKVNVEGSVEIYSFYTVVSGFHSFVQLLCFLSNSPSSRQVFVYREKENCFLKAFLLDLQLSAFMPISLSLPCHKLLEGRLSIQGQDDNCFLFNATLHYSA